MIICLQKQNSVHIMVLGYTRIPTESRPHIKAERNPPRAGSGQWTQVSAYDDEPQEAGLGVPR